MSADLVFLVFGAGLLLAVVLPDLLSRWAVSAPMVLVGAGMLIGLAPLPAGMPLDPIENRAVVEHVTEVTVIVALMGVGLALDRPLLVRGRDRAAAWRAWSPTWRLLGVAMPLTVAGVALLGWWAGLAPAAALLLGAALAPTDPVLASDVQVTGPRTGEGEDDERGESDEVRFSLTSEAGLNDGLAFPLVYAAIMLGTEGSVASWGISWLAWELVGKVAVGVLLGVAVGAGLARLAFRSRSAALRVADRGEPLLVIAALVTAYGVAEVAGGYGFLAVFVCALTVRSLERHHQYHRSMHEVVERLERLFTLVVLLVLGAALTRGVLGALDWPGVAVGSALILLVRPAAAWLALAVRPPRPEVSGGLTRGERGAVAFFGVRGVGSLYYLAYALGEMELAQEAWLWSTVAFTVTASVLVHGITSTPVMARLQTARRAERVSS
ncbi:cation:proton antiporter [Nocardioides nanhaiensis]|uniref:Sodium:proton antiporter n=1 Tax=Nocardioides nanhaiensis TaxID=1476871 RepID=A0ABP8WYC6_9ACTN